MNKLIVRVPNWLGDVVMSLPAIGAVRRAFPQASLIIGATAAVAPLFNERTTAAPDQILVIDRREEIAQLRGTAADAVLLLPNSFSSAWNASRSGISERWGYAAYARSWLLTRAVRRPRGAVHQTRYYLNLVRGLGIQADDEAVKMGASTRSLQDADALLVGSGVEGGGGIVGFAPGAAYGNAKRWPPTRVAEAAAALSARGASIVLVGSAADRPTGREIESALPRGVRVANLIGRTNLGQLVGIIARCAAFASNDSGAMHIAAALGVPLTAVFGPTDERATAPAGHGPTDVILRDVFCRPCMLRECPIDHRCMKRISVEAVVASVANHLDRTSGSENAPSSLH